MEKEKKELTPEQIREKQREHARLTLENKVFQNVLGSNNTRSNPFLYGQLGIQGAESSYLEAMNSKEANEVRTRLYSTKKEQGDRLGVYGEPSVNNYDVSMDIIQQIESNKHILSLGELEGIVKGIAGDLGYDFNVPNELKDYVPKNLIEKIQIASLKAGKVVDPKEVLSEQEFDALSVYQGILSQAYNRGVSLRTANYFGDLNGLGKQISEKYKPKENEK